MSEWLKKVADFLLSQWLWNVTHAMYLVPISLIILLFLLKWVERLNTIRALFLALAAHLFSLIIFSGFVVGVLIFIVRLDYVVPDQVLYHADMCNKLNVTLYVGLIHTFLQSLFFFFVRKRYDLHIIRVTALVLISMSLASLITYLLLPRI